MTLTRVAEQPNDRAVLYAIAIGLMSAAVFGGPALYAVAFWLPVTAGTFGLLFTTGTLAGVAPLVCVLAYAGLTLFAMIALDRQLMERQRATLRLEQFAETVGILLRDFEESSSDWLWETDAALTLRKVSPRFAQVAHRQARHMEVNLLRLLGDAIPQESPPLREPAIAELQRRIEERAPFRELVVPVRLRNEQRWWALTGKPLFDSRGVFTGYRGVGSDVTAAHRSRERIAYLARHDELTGLANRGAFNEALARAVASCRRQQTALLCLDLDEFKTINDTYGHQVGDSLLVLLAGRIRGALRDQDLLARLGGDEFAILLAVESREEAAEAAARVIDSLAAPFVCADLLIRISASIGISIAPEDADDPDVLCRNADLAIYRAKSAGRGTWRMFDVNMDRCVHERRLLQRDLREALGNGELFAMYQPIVDLRTREMVGLEVLVRWEHPEHGIISPTQFVPMAEESGLISEIGRFVLTEATELATLLPAPLYVAVNLSSLQVRDEALPTRVLEMLDRYGLPPERLEFEITESVMLDTGGRSLANLRSLRNRGHRIGIDDFGTGYSSLAVLRGFPFDRLKIDRGFLTDLDSDRAAPMLLAVINLARVLGIAVTGEGVESERQAGILAECQCATAQGYFFSPPLSRAEVMALVPPGESRPRRARIVLPRAANASAEQPLQDLCSG